MRRFIFTLAALLLASFYLLPASAQNNLAQNNILLFEGDTIQWHLEGGVKTYQFNDIIIKLTPKPNDFEVRFDISKKNEKTISFSETGNIGNITIARFNNAPINGVGRQEGYEAAFSIFSGGAHCCSEVYVTDYSNGAKILKVGSFDGEITLPKDLDGDGVMEYVDYDMRFTVFSGYAGAMPPMKIYTIENGDVRDATLDERFLAAHEVHYKRQSIACASMMSENTGACAGLLGTAALLGVYDSTANMLVFDIAAKRPDHSASPYSICIDSDCQQSKTFKDEGPAIDYALTKWGYLPSQISGNKDLTNFIFALNGKSFGENAEACAQGPLSLTVDKKANGHIAYKVSNYDSKCFFEKGALIDTTILAKAVCTSEGEPAWLENHIYNYDGKRLLHSSFTSNRFDDMLVQNLQACGN